MSTSDTTNALLTMNRQLASYFTTGRSATSEGQLMYPRGMPYGEQAMVSMHGAKLWALADEGSYFVARNAPGTAIADTAALTSFAATTPTMTLFNGNATGGKSIYVHRFSLDVAAAGTNGTNWAGQWLIDTGNRYSSGGTALTVSNTNLGHNVASGLTATFGAITASAASGTVRTLCGWRGRTVIKVIGDQYVFEFGASTPVATGMPLEGTTQLHRVFAMPALIIPPQCTALWYEYAASQSVAATFDNIHVDFSER
jgi:hypothetical protein